VQSFGNVSEGLAGGDDTELNSVSRCRNKKTVCTRACACKWVVWEVEKYANDFLLLKYKVLGDKIM